MKYLLVVALLAVQDTAKPLTFSKAHEGKVPPQWTVAKTGTGDGSMWKVVAEATAPSKSGFALLQYAKSPNAVYNICVRDGVKFQDGDIIVKGKCIAGELDQGGGLVWRYKDASNYYVARFNPLENNFRVYKVVDGKRVQLGTREELELPKDKWFSVGVKHTGDKIECTLNGITYLKAEDRTFLEPGLVGLWTKADAQTMFDELVIRTKK